MLFYNSVESFQPLRRFLRIKILTGLYFRSKHSYCVSPSYRFQSPHALPGARLHIAKYFVGADPEIEFGKRETGTL